MAAPTAERPTSRPVPPRRPRKKPAPWPLSLYQTAVGKKWVMAITGIGLIGYVVAHMFGNLKLFLGAEGIYHYGEFLRDMGEPIFPRTVVLWLLRLGLITFFALHIHSAYTLTRMNQASRSTRYQGGRDYQAANFASRTMRWTGIIVGLFVLFHLADLTWGWTSDDWVRGDVYNNVVDSFQRWPVALLYIVANIALGIHIFHGAWSMFQSLGINNPAYNRLRQGLAYTLAAVIVIGNLAFPIAVLTGALDHVEPTYLEEAAALLTRI